MHSATDIIYYTSASVFYALTIAQVDAATMCTLSNYLGLLRKRASGKLKSNAKYMRDFVLAHEDYKKDSKVSELIQYDLLKRVQAISKGEIRPDDLYGDAIMRT